MAYSFLIRIPVHVGCERQPVFKSGSEKNVFGSEKNTNGSKNKTEINRGIIAAIKRNPKVSAAEIAMQLGLSSRAVEKRIKLLREHDIIRRVGPDKGGHWEVVAE